MSDESFRVAFLDDRKDIQQSVIRGMRHATPKDWEFIACPLLSKPTDYAKWLVKEKVLVLLIDQQLDEQRGKSGGPVHYKGHDVVVAIRAVLPEFPIFVVTVIPEDEDLRDHFGEVEDIIRRSSLTERPKEYMSRFMRLGGKYLAQHGSDLEMLSKLAAKRAAGRTSKVERIQLKSLQAKLGLIDDGSSDRDSQIGDLEKEITQLETVGKSVDKLLKKCRKEGRGAQKRIQKKGGNAVEEG